MLLVRVLKGSSRLIGMRRAFPATIMTAMVSPTALPIPRMKLARIPDRAAGRTTLQMVCHLVAPIAMDASLYVGGTLINESNEILMIVGRIIIPSTAEVARMEKPGPPRYSRIRGTI